MLSLSLFLLPGQDTWSCYVNLDAGCSFSWTCNVCCKFENFFFEIAMVSSNQFFIQICSRGWHDRFNVPRRKNESVGLLVFHLLGEVSTYILAYLLLTPFYFPQSNMSTLNPTFKPIHASLCTFLLFYVLLFLQKSCKVKRKSSKRGSSGFFLHQTLQSIDISYIFESFFFFLVSITLNWYAKGKV